MWRVVPVALLAACGRLGFEIADDSPSDGPSSDGPTDAAAGTALLAGSTTCQVSPITLALDRDAEIGDTLLVAFFMREPDAAAAPSIAGATSSWITDVSVSSISATNRRHLSLFRAQLVAKVVAGTQLVIDFPGVQAAGAAAFVIPAGVDHPTTETPIVDEGMGAFQIAHTTTATTSLCVLVHQNAGAATFDSYTKFFELTANCGAARQSAGMHLAIGPTGTSECTGTLNDLNFSWLTIVLGYDNLVP